ncbi:MAG: hypothetical protein ACTHXC_00310 [Brachybacterium sp.]
MRMFDRTIGGFHVAPLGYTRQRADVRQQACDKHEKYYPLCGACVYVFFEVPHTLGERDEDGARVLALILDEDGDVIEEITDDTYPETAATFVGWGEMVVLETAVFEHEPLVSAIQEARLRADCFGVPRFTLPASAPRSRTPEPIH